MRPAFLIALFCAAPAMAQSIGEDHFHRAPPREPRVETELPPTERPPSSTVAADGVELRGLDKVTGQRTDFSVNVGETARYGRLLVQLNMCRRPPEDESPDAFAHLTIRDTREEEARFDGWMIASSPALSALDHARYDVWVLSCSTSSTEASSGNADQSD
ncbi:MAG: DUF2155 domain-containing protein [Pseudomonadota bacterium]